MTGHVAGSRPEQRTAFRFSELLLKGGTVFQALDGNGQKREPRWRQQWIGVFVVLVCLLGAFPLPASAADAPDMEDIRALVEQGRHEQAVHLLEDWMARHPADDEALFLLAGEYARLGQRAQAIERFRLVSAHQPEWPEPHANLAALYAWTDDLEAAVKEERIYLELVPDSAVAQRNLGWLHARLALHYYRQSQRRQPDPEVGKRVEALQALLEGAGSSETRPGSQRMAPEDRP